MPTINSAISTNYLPSAPSPIGFEVVFKLWDPTAGGGTGETFVSYIHIEPVNAVYWTLDAQSSTGGMHANRDYIRNPADEYDPDGISATWTNRISDANDGTPPPPEATRHVLRARTIPGGIIQIEASCYQVTNPENFTVQTLAIPSPVPQGL